LKGFLIQKLRDRNNLGNDSNVLAILDEEAERLLSKPASEVELRKAEKRILQRIEGGQSGRPSRMTGRDSQASYALETGRSAISKASSILDEMGHTKLSGKSYHPPNLHPTALVKNPKAEGAYDYWLRFMEMDVHNFQREENVRKAEVKKRMQDQRKYLDEQVTQKAMQQKAARQADLSWGKEIKKDYNKWQEENLVAEAKESERRAKYIHETDSICAEVENRRAVEIERERVADQKMLMRVQQEMEREKEKLYEKKQEEAKMAEMMKIQNEKLKKLKADQTADQERESIQLQKQYAAVLLKQEKAHKAKQKAFMDEIDRKASRMDRMADEARKKAEAAGAAGAAAEKKAIEDAKDKYRQDMLEAAQKEKQKAGQVKKEFKEALKMQLDLKAEHQRMEKEETKQQMRQMRKELNQAAMKEDEKARRIAEANYNNKLAIDAQIREKQRNKEVGRYLSRNERDMNMGLIRKVEHDY